MLNMFKILGLRSLFQCSFVRTCNYLGASGELHLLCFSCMLSCKFIWSGSCPLFNVWTTSG